jgi:beta-carotene 3-hydroxylase
MILLYITLGIVAFAFMELVAWSNHKFVMHGVLWKWHADHHINDHKNNLTPKNTDKTGFEKNDYFFLVYAVPAIVLLLLGFFIPNGILIALGTGISAYGLTYFFIHDILIHHRLKIPFTIEPKSKYLQALIKAHLAHHRGKNIHDFDNYGLLIFQRRFLKK